MPNKSRQRELARLRNRRDEQRRQELRKRQRRIILSVTGILLVIAATVAFVVNRNNSSASPPTNENARAGAPSAPEKVACGGTIPPRVVRPVFTRAPASSAIPTQTYLVSFQTSCGNFTVKLDPKSAPVTTFNFIFLAERDFYNSTWFHRIVHGSATQEGLIQGGDPKGNGSGGPGYTIADEYPTSKNPYKKYTIAMANTGAPHSGGSQFFINTQNNSKFLAPDYTVFGHVISGFKTIDRIAAIPTGGASGETPKEAAWIEKATVHISGP